MAKTKIIVPVPSERRAKKDRLCEALRKTNGELISALKDAKVQVGVSKGKITALWFRDSWVTDDGLAAVAKQVHVKEFESSDRMTDAGLKHLRNMKDMERIGCNKMTFTGDGLRHLAGMTKLCWLTLCGCTLTDFALSHLPKFPNLELLNMQCCVGFSDDALEHFARITSLTSLHLDGADITGEGTRHLHTLEHLTSLSLRGVDHRVNDDALRHLPSLPKLESLDFDNSGITPKGISAMPTLPRLERLELSRTRVTDNSLKTIAKRCPDLKSLQLNETKVTDNAVPHLLALPKLERVEMENTRVTRIGIQQLLEAKPGLGIAAYNRTDPDLSSEPIQLIERPKARKAASVAKSWRRIEGWFKKHYPQALESLRPPATKSDIDQLEKRIGRPFPDDFKESYLIHDGQHKDERTEDCGLIFGLPLEPLGDEDGILWLYDTRVDDEWPTDLGPYCSDWEFYPPDTIRSAWTGPGWIPFYWDVGRNFIGIDLDPGPNGIVGQVIPFGDDDEFRPVLAQSWAHFLQDIADELEAGHAVIDLPEVSDAPFRLRGAPNGYFPNCYEAWAKAKLPRAFQNVRPVPKRRPEDDAAIVEGKEAELFLSIVRDFFKAMNEFELDWLNIRPIREFGLDSLQDCGPDNTRGWSQITRYPGDEPQNERQRLMWDADANFDEQAELLELDKHYKPAMAQKRKIGRRFLTKADRSFNSCFLQFDPPWYDPSVVNTGEVRQMSADHVFIDYAPLCRGSCTGDERWRFHLKREGRSWKIDYHENIADPDKAYKLDLP